MYMIFNKSSQSNLGTARHRPHWLQWDAKKFTRKTAPSPSTITNPYPSLDRPHSPPQTASGSNQPFCHNTFSGQRDRQMG